MTAIFLAMAISMFAQDPAAGSIEGSVCEVQTCRPIAGARLAVRISGVQASRRTVITGIAGIFRFQQLPAGKYQLEVEADGFAVSGILPLVTLADAGIVQDLKIEMRALGIISGHAFDEIGEPLVGARVEAMAFRPQAYFRMLMPIASSETDDRGEFRIPALEADEYYVRVLPPINRFIKDSFPITYYPNTTDPSTAAKIVVSGGAEAAGIDPKLPTRGVKVRGRIENSEGGKGPVLINLMPRSPSVLVAPAIGVNTVDETIDDFEISGVAPGSYYLYAINRNGFQGFPEWVRMPLEVAGKDVDDVRLAVIPAGTVKGRIVVASDALDAQKLDLSKLTISAGAAELAPIGFRNGTGALVSQNGEFQIPHLSEMKLFLRDLILSDSWFISSARFDGNDALTTGFSSSPGKESTLEIVISNVSGTFTGVIKDREEKPIPAGRIILLPEGSRRNNPFLTRTGVAIEKGEFTIEVIPPGDYTAIALLDEDQFTPAFLRDPVSVEKYERFGEHIRIYAGEVTRTDLTTAPVEPN